MTRYVAFLRAVNVGKRTVKMEDLRRQLDTAGFKNVTTYIQSGNVMFESGDAGAHAAPVIASLQSAAETLHMKGREVYTLIQKNLEAKPLGVIARLEKKLGLPCTTRNWATVNKVIW